MEEITSVISENRLKPSSLTMEITENQSMEHPQSVADVLKALSTIGVRIALDDFDTGYSSLSCLATFPGHVLKIDRSFITRLAGCLRRLLPARYSHLDLP